VADGSTRHVEARPRGEDAAAVRGLRPAADGARVPLLGVSDVASTTRSAGALNPALIEHARQRAQSVENRIADRITAFSGSMRFVYIHAIWFACWIGFGVEAYPYGLLTMIVSLEAIFLSTFVMISQNRADAKRQVLADQQWQTVQEEDGQNQELLRLSREILELTRAVHADAGAQSSRDEEPTG
jgi:uncharacterized membrane protein